MPSGGAHAQTGPDFVSSAFYIRNPFGAAARTIAARRAFVALARILLDQKHPPTWRCDA
jgi:hypothetical protein